MLKLINKQLREHFDQFAADLSQVIAIPELVIHRQPIPNSVQK